VELGRENSVTLTPSFNRGNNSESINFVRLAASWDRGIAPLGWNLTVGITPHIASEAMTGEES
jgi:hypothetical protein